MFLPRKYKDFTPEIGNRCFIAPSADVIGDVKIGDGSSVWFNAVVRADIAPIRIGKNVSIQDNCMLHVSQDIPVEIADDVAVGHSSTVHSASISTNTIIGMGATLLTNSRIGKNCIIGAGSVVTEGTEVPDNSVAMGIPAKVVKKVTDEHLERIKRNIQEYVELNRDYLGD